MPPTNENRFVKGSTDDDFLAPLDPTQTYVQDSCVAWDDTNLVIIPCTSDTLAAKMIGIVRDINPVQVYSDKTTPNQPSPLVRVTGLMGGSQFRLFATAGEHVIPGAAIFQGADEVTFSMTGTTANRIGTVSFEQPEIAVAVAGTGCLVDIFPPFPVKN